MRNNQTISPLGWGIIGCPNGYQFSSAGVDKYFHIAQNYLDLKGNIGEILPDPDKKDLSPLFCLSQFEEKGHQIFTLAEYHSIKQKNSNRSGNFLGAFIEVVDHQFNLSTTKVLFEVLHSLCIYQYERFVDRSENRYKEDIEKKPLLTLPMMKQLEVQLKPWKRTIPNNDSAIFLYYENTEQLYSFFKIILDVDLPFYYKRIYFSPSREIAEGFLKAEGKVISPSFTASDEKLRSYLLNKIQLYIQEVQRVQAAKTEVEKHLEGVKKHQEQIIKQEVEQRVYPYIEQLKAVEQEKTQLLKTIDLVKRGSSVLEDFGKRVDNLDQTNLAQFASSMSERENVSGQLSNIENRIVKLSSELEKIKPSNQQQIAQVEKEPSNLVVGVMTILTVLCTIFLGLTIWFAFFSSPSESEIKESTVYKGLESKLKTINDKVTKETRDTNEKANKTEQAVN